MDSDENISADEAHEIPVPGAGVQLRTAREACGLELTHIAAETRIPLRHLEAIEAGNFESLPSRAYALGFSRTFARAVGLDDVAITDAIRGELADGSMRRTVTTSGMEPGDPAKLPSAGLAWAGAFAALVLAIGAIAFFNSYFGAGAEPRPLAAPEQAAQSAIASATAAEAEAEPALSAGGAVVLTAMEDGVWLRLYEAGGERIVERTLKQGEQVTVPVSATDPLVNTGRPDALAITVGGKSVARLSDKAVTMSAAAVSASALLARITPAPAPTPIPTAGRVTPDPATTTAARPVARRTATAAPVRQTASSVQEAAGPAPAPAAMVAPAPVPVLPPAPATSAESGEDVAN